MNSTIGLFSTDTKVCNDMYIYECGFEHCKPRDPYQYEQINYYLIHYIIDGEGLFFMDGKVYNLKKGDIFFIPPKTDNNYYPSTENPWTYRWIGINGSKVQDFLNHCGFNNNYVLHYDKDNKIDTLFSNIFENSIKNNYFEALGNLYLFLSILKSEFSSASSTSLDGESYIQKSLSFIEDNYDKSITVSDIAKYLNVDRSHFYKLFKLSMMVTPQQYLIDFKLKKSCDLLRKSSYSINEISLLLGFSSQSYFSKLFKKNLNLSPLEYRNTFIKK